MLSYIFEVLLALSFLAIANLDNAEYFLRTISLYSNPWKEPFNRNYKIIQRYSLKLNWPCCVLNTTLNEYEINVNGVLWQHNYHDQIIDRPPFHLTVAEVFVYFSLNPDALTQSLPRFKRDNF